MSNINFDTRIILQPLKTCNNVDFEQIKSPAGTWEAPPTGRSTTGTTTRAAGTESSRDIDPRLVRNGMYCVSFTESLKCSVKNVNHVTTF